MDKCEMENKLYEKIYGEIIKNLSQILDNYHQDKNESYEAGMSLLMISMKMLMFSGMTPEDVPILCNKIKETFDRVYNDFKRVDLNL
jgi:hypothetical protein